MTDINLCTIINNIYEILTPLWAVKYTKLIDSLSSKDLYEYVANDMADFVDKLTLNELIEEVKYTIDEEFLDEMITTIKEKIKD